MNQPHTFKPNGGWRQQFYDRHDIIDFCGAVKPDINNKKKRTRRDTATATSRLVGNVLRGLNLNPRLDARSRW